VTTEIKQKLKENMKLCRH